MGHGPHEVDQWEPWQFQAVQRAFMAKHTKGPRAPTAEEYRAALARTVH